jgi:hypothetical protein
MTLRHSLLGERVRVRGEKGISPFLKGTSADLISRLLFLLVIPAEAGIQSNNFMIQILPIRISTFDQFKFPDSFPFLQPLLPLNSRLHALVQFVPNQMVDTITFGKSFHHVIPVLPYPFDEI